MCDDSSQNFTHNIVKNLLIVIEAKFRVDMGKFVDVRLIDQGTLDLDDLEVSIGSSGAVLIVLIPCVEDDGSLQNRDGHIDSFTVDCVSQTGQKVELDSHLSRVHYSPIRNFSLQKTAKFTYPCRRFC